MHIQWVKSAHLKSCIYIIAGFPLSGKVLEKYVVMQNQKKVDSHGKVKFYPNSRSKYSPVAYQSKYFAR